MKPAFVVYEGADGQWYWRLVAANGKTIAQGEGYPRERNARRAVATIKRVVKGIK